MLWQPKPPRPVKTAGLSDGLHVGLDIPRHAGKQIHNWVKEQQWPEGTELEQPSDYHITLLYTPNGHQEHAGAWWIKHLQKAQAKVVGFDVFPSQENPMGHAYVLRVESPEIREAAEELQRRAESQGLEITKFPGGYKPHITIAYGPEMAKDGPQPPPFDFDVGPSEISPPRYKEEEQDNSWDETGIQTKLAAFIEPWQPGSPGKGLITPLGSPLHWKTTPEADAEDDDIAWAFPHHTDVEASLGYKDRYGIMNSRAYFYIHPDGRVETVSHNPPKDNDRFLTSHPAFRLVSRTSYTPGETQALDHLSLSSVAHNLHYKFAEGMEPGDVANYAQQLLKLIGYPTDEITTQAALQAWQQMYPQDKLLPAKHAEVWQGTTPAWENGAMGNRKPFRYYPDADVLTLGQWGTHHKHLDQDFPLLEGGGKRPPLFDQVSEGEVKRVPGSGLIVVNPWNSNHAQRALQLIQEQHPEAQLPLWGRDGMRLAGLAEYAEMVPTQALDHLREWDRRPGNMESGADPAYWNQLKNHIAEHGFEDPLTLEYNHDTGRGYLGEGNHRLQIAQELGLSHVPLMVYRSTKDDERMKPMHEPGTYSMRDARGFSQFPQYARPSEIGLPTQGAYTSPGDDWYQLQRAERERRRQQQPEPRLPKGDMTSRRCQDCNQGWIPKTAQLGLQYQRTSVPNGHGADDYETDEGDSYTLHAIHDGRLVGSLDYNHLPESQQTHIRWIDVPEEYKRRGIATGLVNRLKQLHPDHEITTSGLTQEGEEFWPQVTSKVAAETASQRLRRAQELEAQYGPDQSKVVHQFPDGWSVRQLQTYADAQREGHLMRNCFAHDTTKNPNEIWAQHPQIRRSDNFLHDNGYDRSGITEFDLPLPDDNEYGRLYSLRDPSNLPHVSIDPNVGVPALGQHNGPPHIKYKPYLQEWAAGNEFSDINDWADTLDDPDNPGEWFDPGATSEKFAWTSGDLTQRLSETWPSQNPWQSPHEADLLEIEHPNGMEYPPAALQAMRHTGQIPGDERFTGDLNIYGENPNRGVNKSYIGGLGKAGTPSHIPVYVKPGDGYDLPAERAAFAIAHHMGVPVPHTVVRTTPGQALAQVQQSVGGQNGRSFMGDSFDFNGFKQKFPNEARQISLFDHVIGNNDRHLGNVVQGEDGKIYPIDHGFAFHPSWMPEGLSDRYSGQPLTEDEISSLMRAGDVDVSKIGVDPAAHKEMQQRIDWMVNHGRFLMHQYNPYHPEWYG